MRWALSVYVLMWETKYWFILFKLMPVWGNFSLNFCSLQSSNHGDVGCMVTWYNIQWIICSDNFYEQEKKSSSNACHAFWPFFVVHLPPVKTTCFLLWCSVCRTWGRNDCSGIQPLVNFSPDVCSRWLSWESTTDPDFLFNINNLDSNWNNLLLYLVDATSQKEQMWCEPSIVHWKLRCICCWFTVLLQRRVLASYCTASLEQHKWLQSAVFHEDQNWPSETHCVSTGWTAWANASAVCVCGGVFGVDFFCVSVSVFKHSPGLYRIIDSLLVASVTFSVSSLWTMGLASFFLPELSQDVICLSSFYSSNQCSRVI